jgi:hypothetical protein
VTCPNKLNAVFLIHAPEITVVAGTVLSEVTMKLAGVESIGQVFGQQLAVTKKDIGGAGLLSSNDPLPKDTLQLVCLRMQFC